MALFSRENWKSAAAMLVLVFIVVTGGVTAGLYISKELGIAVWARSAALKPEVLTNSTNLKLGDKFPECLATDTAGTETDVRLILEGHKTVVGVVTNGCEACSQFMAALDSGKIVPEGFSVLLLSAEPEYFEEHYRYPVMRISPEFMARTQIHSMPTVFGVDEAATLKVICSGFTALLNPSFMERSI